VWPEGHLIRLKRLAVSVTTEHSKNKMTLHQQCAKHAQQGSNTRPRLRSVPFATQECTKINLTPHQLPAKIVQGVTCQMLDPMQTSTTRRKIVCTAWQEKDLHQSKPSAKHVSMDATNI
jgi:hypothetical protein